MELKTKREFIDAVLRVSYDNACKEMVQKLRETLKETDLSVKELASISSCGLILHDTNELCYCITKLLEEDSWVDPIYKLFCNYIKDDKDPIQKMLCEFQLTQGIGSASYFENLNAYVRRKAIKRLDEQDTKEQDKMDKIIELSKLMADVFKDSKEVDESTEELTEDILTDGKTKGKELADLITKLMDDKDE